MSLNKKQVKAARLVAEDVMTDVQISEECGVDRRTITRWKAIPGFAAQVESIKAKAVKGAEKASEDKAFNTTDRLIELANLAPKDTNGTIGGQVKACSVIAQIRGEIIERHEDVTKVSAAERRKRVIGLLREGAQRIDKVQ